MPRLLKELQTVSQSEWPGVRRPLLEVVNGWHEFPARLHGGVLSIGNFDGVHRGHQQILRQLVQTAARHQVPSIVFTFAPHPLAVLRPKLAPVALTNFATRARLLARYGIDVMVICPAEPRLFALEYTQFFDQVIKGSMRPAWMFEGPNFYFGKDRQGSPQRLKQLCQASDIDLKIVEPQVEAGEMISSSSIRTWIADGDIEAANKALGHRYELMGKVEHGDGRGRTLGVPTANLTQLDTLIPGDGVYAAVARTRQGVFPAAVNVGAPVTFGKLDRRVEVHLLDFEGDLYEMPLAVEFVARLRSPLQFSSADELLQQMKQDIANVRSSLRTGSQHPALISELK